MSDSKSVSPTLTAAGSVPPAAVSGTETTTQHARATHLNALQLLGNSRKHRANSIVLKQTLEQIMAGGAADEPLSGDANAPAGGAAAASASSSSGGHHRTRSRAGSWRPTSLRLSTNGTITEAAPGATAEPNSAYELGSPPPQGAASTRSADQSAQRSPQHQPLKSPQPQPLPPPHPPSRPSSTRHSLGPNANAAAAATHAVAFTAPPSDDHTGDDGPFVGGAVITPAAAAVAPLSSPSKAARASIEPAPSPTKASANNAPSPRPFVVAPASVPIRDRRSAPVKIFHPSATGGGAGASGGAAGTNSSLMAAALGNTMLPATGAAGAAGAGAPAPVSASDMAAHHTNNNRLSLGMLPAAVSARVQSMLHDKEEDARTAAEIGEMILEENAKLEQMVRDLSTSLEQQITENAALDKSLVTYKARCEELSRVNHELVHENLAGNMLDARNNAALDDTASILGSSVMSLSAVSATASGSVSALMKAATSAAADGAGGGLGGGGGGSGAAILQAVSDFCRSELSVQPTLEFTGDLLVDIRSVKRQLAQERKHHKRTRFTLEETVQTLSDEKTAAEQKVASLQNELKTVSQLRLQLEDRTAQISALEQRLVDTELDAVAATRVKLGQQRMKATVALEKADQELGEARARCTELERKIGGLEKAATKARVTEAAYHKLLVATQHADAAAVAAQKLQTPTRSTSGNLLSPTGGGAAGVTSPPGFHPSPMRVPQSGGMAVSAIMKVDEAMTRIHDLELELERRDAEYNQLLAVHNASQAAGAATATATATAGASAAAAAPASTPVKAAPTLPVDEPVDAVNTKTDETTATATAAAAPAGAGTDAAAPSVDPALVDAAIAAEEALSPRVAVVPSPTAEAEAARIAEWETRHQLEWEQKWTNKEKDLEAEWRADFETRWKSKESELRTEHTKRLVAAEHELETQFAAKKKAEADTEVEQKQKSEFEQKQKTPIKATTAAPAPAHAGGAVPSTPTIVITPAAPVADAKYSTPLPGGNASGGGGGGGAALVSELKIISGFTFDEPPFPCTPHDQELLHKVFLMLGGQWMLAQSVVPSNPVVSLRSWTPDTDVTQCTLCRNKFTFFKRKHHCRLCGGVYCAVCSSHTQTLSKFKLVKVRVCNVCFVIVQSMELPESVGLTPAPTPRAPAGMRSPAPSLVQQLTGGSALAVSNGRLSLLSPAPKPGAGGGADSRFNSVRSGVTPNRLGALPPVGSSPTPSMMSVASAIPPPALTLGAGNAPATPAPAAKPATASTPATAAVVATAPPASASAAATAAAAGGDH